MKSEHNLIKEQQIEATREYFTKLMDEGDPIHKWFPLHVKQVERCAKKILPYFPEANPLVVELSVWLHDSGHRYKKDFKHHEIVSEVIAREFLPTLGINQHLTNQVAHAVRTHRCKPDALPQTIEAKILAAADSMSHIVDIVYVYMLNDGNSRETVLAKLERDIRDIQFLPNPLLQELKPLCEAWRNVIIAYPKDW